MRQGVTDAETSSVAFEKRYIHQDGRTVWVTVTSSAVDDQTGRPLYLVTQVQDITTLKQAQAEAVGEIARREEFLSIAAHELKTTITSIKASAQFLRRLLQDEGPDAHQLQRLVTQQHGQIGRLEELVSDLLDVSRIHRGRLELRRERYALGDLVQEVVERFHHAPEYTRHHRLAVEDHGLVIGEWDRARLDQVLTNLVSNALKYSPAGGDVMVGVATDRDHAVLTVRDHGIGIAEEMLDQVFTRFARREYHVPVMYGTGLGLYITRQIVEHHGGQISLASTPGQGTTVTVRLPRVVDLIS
jgi:signal transduction histidine kinase